jgi:hypothetical protein
MTVQIAGDQWIQGADVSLSSVTALNNFAGSSGAGADVELLSRYGAVLDATVSASLVSLGNNTASRCTWWNQEPDAALDLDAQRTAGLVATFSQLCQCWSTPCSYASSWLPACCDFTGSGWRHTFSTLWAACKRFQCDPAGPQRHKQSRFRVSSSRMSHSLTVAGPPGRITLTWLSDRCCRAW